MYSLLHSSKEAHEDAIWCCAWGEIQVEKEANLDGNDQKLCDCVVTGSVDNSVRLWIFRNNKLELHKTFTGHLLGVISVALNSDCSFCASSSLDSNLILWDVKKGTKLKTVMVGSSELWTIAFSPDDKYVISGSHSGKIRMFNLEKYEMERTFDTRGTFTLSISCSPDGKHIASGALDGIVNIFDMQNSKLTHTLEGHAMPIRSLCFSPDSKYLLTASDDCHMKIYDVQHATVVSTVSGHSSWVTSVAFSPDGKYFISASSDRTVKVWEFLPTELRVNCLHTFREHEDQVWCAKYNKLGTNIVSVSDDTAVNIYSCPVLKS